MMAKKVAADEAVVDFSGGDSLMVDLSNVEDLGEREILPAAFYPCVITACEFKYSNEKGTPMWSLTLEVSDGEYAGRPLYTHLVMDGKGLPFTKRTLARIAPELLEAAFNPEDADTISSMLGKHVRAKVTVGMYLGDKTNNVRDLYAGEEGSFVG